MTEWLPAAGAAVSVVLMGICGAGLLVRFIRMMSGQAPSALPDARGALPLRGMARAALAMLFTRAALIVLAYGMYRLIIGTGDSLLESFRPLWEHWDVRHYVAIAEEGYTATGDERLRLVFFPMLPLLMRLLSPLAGGSAFAAGTVISLAAAACAAALLYALACAWRGEETARRAVLYFTLNPMSVFMGCVYTEAPFLCLTLACAYLLCRGRPLAAALCGAASALTRMPGVIVSGLFLIVCLERLARGERPAGAIAACLGQMAIVFSGLVAYWALNAWVTGNPMMYLTYQRENWYQQPGTFWQSTANTVHYLLTTAGEEDWLWTWGFQLVAMACGYAMLAFGQKRLPFALAAYAFVYVAVVFAPTWLLSGARYLYGLICLPLLQATLPAGRGTHRALLGGSALLLVLFTYGYTIAVTVL